MLHNYERGYAVMTKSLDAFSFQSPDIETSKRYCKNGDVIVDRIPYKCGISLRITWHKYWHKPIYFKKLYREGNVFYLHFNWNNEYMHKNGKVIYKS